MAAAVSLRSLFSRVKDLSSLAPPVVSGGGAWVRRWSGCVPICWLSQWWRVVAVAARGGSAWFERWCMVVARVIGGVYFGSVSELFRWFTLPPPLEFSAVWPCASLSHPILCAALTRSPWCWLLRVSVRQWVTRPASSLVGVFPEGEFYAVRSLYMWIRFNGCKRSQEVGFEDGILRACFSNDGIVA